MQLKSNCVWQEGFKAEIDNGRGHSVSIDLPENKGGTNSAAMALELMVMSFAGCIVTIFALLAKKMQIEFNKLSCEVSAERPDDAATITECHAIVKISSASDETKLIQCLKKTEKICPVGVIFDKAGIVIKIILERI